MILTKHIWFPIGFALTVIVSIFLNLRSYYIGSAEFDSRRIKFDHDGFYWGFPLAWIHEGTCFPCYIDNSMIIIGFWTNVLLCAIASVAVGLAFRFVASRLRRPIDLP